MGKAVALKLMQKPTKHGRVSKNRKTIIDLTVKSRTVQTNQAGVWKYFTHSVGVDLLKCLEKVYSCNIKVESRTEITAGHLPVIVEEYYDEYCDGLERLKAEVFHLPEFLAVDKESAEGPHTSEPMVVKLGILNDPALINGKETQNACAIKMGKVKLQFCQGDITMEKADAIITVNDSYLNLDSGGGLNRAIAKLGGQLVEFECSQNMAWHGPFESGQVIMTSAGGLPSKHILHAVLCSHLQSGNKSLVQGCIFKCLQLADTKGLTSIAMPVIGTGLLHMSVVDAADAIYGAFQSFAQMSPGNLHDIRVVVYSNSPSVSYPQFQQCLLEKHSNNVTSNMLSHLSEQSEGVGLEASGIQHTRFPRKGSSVTFHVLANDETNLNRAVNDLEGKLMRACTSQRVHHEEIGHLSAERRKRLLAHEITYDVSLNFDGSGVLVSGCAEDVCSVVCKIWEEITETVKERQAGSNNDLLSRYIQWVYIVNGKEVQCSKKVNSLLEHAIVRSHLQGVQFLVGEHQYYTDFRAMTVTCLSRGRAAIPLLRKVLEQSDEIPLPYFWFPQPRLPSGAYETPYLVKLNHASLECQEVLRRFSENQKRDKITVQRVQRVQNPYLHQSYTLRKRKMSSESRGTENEKLLFHGTKAWNVPSINAQGFNRSFAGTHAALFGDGVYFARDSGYSFTYTSPDCRGERHVYLVRVLVGRFTKGQSGMKQPPPINQIFPEKLYDSLVDNVKDPRIHVVFHDAQMYPEYLISFFSH